MDDDRDEHAGDRGPDDHLRIVGGELSRGGEALLEGVREAIRRSALPAAAESVEVRAGSLGPRAEVLGALALIIRDTTRVSPSLSAA